MSVLKGEGKVPILFGSGSIAAGSVIHRGYIARPDLAGEWPTVIVLSAAWGVTSSTKDICRRLARQGLAVVAPDLHAGWAPPRSVPLDQAERITWALAAARSAAIIEDIVEFVQNPAGVWSNAGSGYGILTIGSGVRPGVAAATGRGVLGLAMISPVLVGPAPVVMGEEEGGDESDAIEQPEPEDVTGALAAITAPMMALSGSADPALPTDRIERARSAAPHAEWIVYEGLGADFADDYSEGFDAPAFADAMERVTAFFEKLLPAV